MLLWRAGKHKEIAAVSKVTTCLWFGTDAEMAVNHYISLVPGSALEHIRRSPADWPGGAAGDAIVADRA